MTIPAADSTFLYNANVLTLDQQNTVGTGLLIEAGRVTRVVVDDEHVTDGHRRVDLAGATVLPGFIDAHAHPLALGSALAAVDCSPDAVSSISELGNRLAAAAAHSPAGWIRARGYDELLLDEKRHPTAIDLEIAAPGRLIRLSHGSGHGDVLSTAALSALGIGKDTTLPPGGTIERNPVTGEPTGVLFEMGGWLRERLPEPSDQDLKSYAKAASSQLVAAGVTSITDAGRENSAQRPALYSALVADGLFLLRPTVMLSPSADRSVVAGGSDVRVGATKSAITFSGGNMHPGFDVLVELVSEQHRAHRQVAIHAVELEAVIMATEVFTAVGSRSENVALRHRIEHASECPPEVAMLIADAGVSVVTQPGFVHERGERYLSAWRDGGADPEDLYAAKILIEAGIHVAGSSDAPFGPTPPLTAIQAAVTRCATNGEPVGPGQAISSAQALGLYGPGAAWIDHQETEIGTIEPGKRADLVVLESDPSRVDPKQISSIPVLATLIGGVAAYGALQGG